MTSVADTSEGFNRLVNAVNELNSKLPVVCTKNAPPPFSLPEVVIPPRQAVNMPSEEVFREKAIGRVSAQLIAKYPPGIALLAPGERVTVLPREQKTLWVIK
jgi:lysine decarboxylase